MVCVVRSVQTDANWEGKLYPSVQNSFYDIHVSLSNYDILGFTNVYSCSATAVQIYTCNGKTIGTFHLTNTYSHGILAGQYVTNVGVTKQ